VTTHAHTTTFPQLQRLTIADLAEVASLYEVVAARLPTGFIRAKRTHELAAYLDGTEGVAYGIASGAGLAAVSLLRLPVVAHPNGGPPFPLVPATDWPLHACFLENAMVRPEARGRGYQRALLDVRLAHAASAGMRWVCGGVRLRNVVSWRNLLATGMVIAGIRFDPGYPVIGVLRATNGMALASDPGDCILVDVDDSARHQAALAAGYVGARVAGDGRVVYQRRRAGTWESTAVG
jgi:GNAT superfamily N-acetyltransferase